MPPSKIHIIASPFHVGIQGHRVGAGPSYLIERGLISRLSAAGKDVTTETIPAVDDHEGDIGRSFEVIRRVSLAVSRAIADNAFPLVLSGNCNNTVGVVAGLGAHNADIVWFDAHPDFDTPEETLSGYFDVNGVSILAGEAWQALAGTVQGHKAIDVTNFRYVGLRDFSGPAQREKASRFGGEVIYGGKETPEEGFAKALDATFTDEGGLPCVLHFDVDSLDTSVGIANFAASPGGLTKEDAVESVRVIKKHRKPVSMTVASFDPDYDGSEGIADAAIAAVLEAVS